MKIKNVPVGTIVFIILNLFRIKGGQFCKISRIGSQIMAHEANIQR